MLTDKTFINKAFTGVGTPFAPPPSFYATPDQHQCDTKGKPMHAIFSTVSYYIMCM